MSEYDVVVVGVGSMGSATVAHLAGRGHDILGLERFGVPTERGAAGRTRLFRLAYREDPEYVPLLRRARDLWHDLEAETGRSLLYRTGSVAAAPDNDPDGEFEGGRRTCEVHDIDHEVLSGAETNDRFPGYDLPDDYRVCYQPDGGFLDTQACIAAHVEVAHANGATIRAREPVETVEFPDSGVRVVTDRDSYTADEAVVTAGAWAADLVPALDGLAVPVTEALGWFQPAEPAAFAPGQFPVFVMDGNDETPGAYYGTPVYDVPGFKIGRHAVPGTEVPPTDPTPPEPTREDETLLREGVRGFLPTADGPTLRLTTCAYTNSPDGHFILDRAHDRLVVGAGFSGHGFKFASVVGEILADLVEGGSDHDLEKFRLGRF